MKALIACLLLAGCGTSPIDMRDVTITYKPTGDHPGEAGSSRTNGASWERWVDHPTYILLHKDGAVIRMPEGVKGGQ